MLHAGNVARHGDTAPTPPGSGKRQRYSNSPFAPKFFDALLGRGEWPRSSASHCCRQVLISPTAQGYGSAPRESKHFSNFAFGGVTAHSLHTLDPSWLHA